MKVAYDVVILAEAEADLDTAFVWYETKQPGLGDRFFDSVNKSILSIGKKPLIYEEVYKGTRRCVIEKFPYGVYYKIIPGNSTIQIVGIVHFKRDPKILKDRL